MGWLALSVLPVPRVVGVARAVLLEDVVRLVVQTAEAQRRPAVVAFRRVVEHDIENDLDAGPVQRLDHIAKFIHRAKRILTRAVGLVRRKERDRRIAPVIDFSRRAVLGIELEHRQQFDGRDAELLEIGNLLDQTGIGPAFVLSDAGTGMAGEAAHVHFIDDGPSGGPFQRRITFPIVRRRVHHHALHCRRGIVAFSTGSLAAVVFRHHDAAAVRIEQYFGRIKAHSLRQDHRRLERDSRKSVPAAHPAQTRASSGRYGWMRDRGRSRAPALRHPAGQRDSNSTPAASRENRLKLTPP